MAADRTPDGASVAETRRCHVFIAYRQDDGREVAEWLYRHLEGERVEFARLHARGRADDGRREVRTIESYYDQTTPALGDWLGYWRDKLKVSHALVLVCTPGAGRRRRGVDRLYEEIEFWLDEKSEAPILVEVTDGKRAVVPENVRRRWPNAQRVSLTSGERTRDGSGQRRPTIVKRIVDGIELSATGIFFEELERLRRLNDEVTSQFARFSVEASKQRERVDRILLLAEAASVAPGSATAAPFLYETEAALAQEYVIDRLVELGHRPAMSPDGSRVIDWIDSSTARLIDPFDTRCQRELRHPTASRLIHWDGTGVVTCGAEHVHLWSASGEPTGAAIPGHLATNEGLRDRAVVQRPDGALAIHDRTGAQLFATRPFDTRADRVKLVEGRLIASFPELYVVDLDDETEHVVELTDPDDDATRPSSVRISATGAYIAGLIGRERRRDLADAVAVWRLDGTAATMTGRFEKPGWGIHAADFVGDRFLAIEWWEPDGRRRKARTEDRVLELHPLEDPDAEVLRANYVSEWSITHDGRGVHATSRDHDRGAQFVGQSFLHLDLDPTDWQRRSAHRERTPMADGRHYFVRPPDRMTDAKAMSDRPPRTGDEYEIRTIGTQGIASIGNGHPHVANVYHPGLTDAFVAADDTILTMSGNELRRWVRPDPLYGEDTQCGLRFGSCRSATWSGDDRFVALRCDSEVIIVDTERSVNSVVPLGTSRLRPSDDAILPFDSGDEGLLGITDTGEIQVLGGRHPRPLVQDVKVDEAVRFDRSVVAADNTARTIWVVDAIDDPTPRIIRRHRSRITTLQPYGQEGLLIGTASGLVQLIDVADGTEIASTRTGNREGRSAVTRIMCDDPDRPVIIVTERGVATWDPAGDPGARAECPGLVGARWAPTADVLITWGAELRFWEPRKRTLIETAEAIENRFTDRDRKNREVGAIDCRFVDRSDLLVMLNGDGALRYVDPFDPRVLGVQRLCHHALDFKGASLASDGRRAICWWKDYSGENVPQDYGITVGRLQLDLEPKPSVWKSSVERRLGARLTATGKTAPLEPAELRSSARRR